MAQKTAEEIEESAEERKLLTKQFNKFLNDYFNWIIAGIVAVVFVVGFFVLLLPKYEQTVNYVNVVNQQQILDANSKQAELTKIQQLLAAYNGIDKSYIDKIKAIAPTIQNKEELFSQLNYLISANQLFLQSISLTTTDGYQDQGLIGMSPAQKKIADSIETVNISLSVAGVNYESFKNLLAAFENNLRLMDIVSVNFSPESQATNLSINTYYSKN